MLDVAGLATDLDRLGLPTVAVNRDRYLSEKFNGAAADRQRSNLGSLTGTPVSIRHMLLAVLGREALVVQRKFKEAGASRESTR
jgi:hypothetical protein